jgi:hypothetical protein
VRARGVPGGARRGVGPADEKQGVAYHCCRACRSLMGFAAHTWPVLPAGTQTLTMRGVNELPPVARRPQSWQAGIAATNTCRQIGRLSGRLTGRASEGRWDRGCQQRNVERAEFKFESILPRCAAHALIESRMPSPNSLSHPVPQPVASLAQQ